MASNLFNKIYLSGVILIVLLPILAVPPVFHPADWGKAIVFRIIFSILIFFFIIQVLSEKTFLQYIAQKIEGVPKYFLFGFSGYAALLIVSTIFAPEPYFSFWGSPLRGGGTLNILLYMAFGLFCYLVFQKKDWLKVWFSAHLGGLAVSFVAIAQQFALFPKILAAYTLRPPSTMGNTNFLGAYLVILFFVSIASALKAKRSPAKIFYFSCTAVFAFTIAITISKAAYLGVILGILWIVLTAKFKKPLLNKLKWIVVLAPLLLAAILLFSANNAQVSAKLAAEGNFLNNFISRFSFHNLLGDSRFVSWKTGLEALKDRPLLGYGPENFSIGFNKYYNEKVPNQGGPWWDRAHNFLLDIGLTAGLPALLAFIFFWGYLFNRLQKTKKISPENSLTASLLQAVFIGYFLTIFFGFDCMPTYLFTFLIAGFSLHLISSENQPEFLPKSYGLNLKLRANGKNLFIAGLFIFLLFFIWQYNIVPLKTNAAINWANFYLQIDKTCDRAENKLKPFLSSNGIVHNYLFQVYGNVMSKCVADRGRSDKTDLVKQGIEAGEKIVEQRPYDARTWIYLGTLTNYLLERNPENLKLQNQMNYYFTKAAELAPGHADIYSGRGRGYIYYKKCQEAFDMAQKCLSANEEFRDCWWISTLSNICLGNHDLAEKQKQIAWEKSYVIGETDSLLDLVKIYIFLLEQDKNKDNHKYYYEQLAFSYYWLAIYETRDPQYRASLAYVYKILGKYKEARKQALILKKLFPETKTDVDAFLKTLP